MNCLEKNIKVYYTNIVLATIAKTMPHAILTILFLSKGVSISEIAFIQALYSVAMVICEFPSGMMSDLYSRKKVYIISLITLMVSYIIIISFEGVVYMSIAWVAYGISTALATGTLDAEIINQLKEKDGDLQKFFKNSNQISLIVSILSVSIGSLLYYQVADKMYLISILLIFANICVVQLFFVENKINHSNNKPKLATHIKESFTEVKNNPTLLWFILLFGGLQFFIQTHFQLWQALFLEKGLKEEWFFIYYIIFQVVMIWSYKVKVEKINLMHLSMLVLMAILLSVVLFFSNFPAIDVTIYLSICFIGFVINYFSTFHFSKLVSKEKISSLTSLSSTITRIFSFLVLGISTLLLNEMNIKLVYMINFVVAFSISITVLLIIKMIDKKTNVAECSTYSNDNL
ncbi:MAG: hypothetical protein ATN31_06275 [Candidatus Epulonipiscioides saccharophilum]|nr:MAG: hypothetical protein ATN31_06275 [Epulopiscium sp. AS2M-Bin001]